MTKDCLTPQSLLCLSCPPACHSRLRASLKGVCMVVGKWAEHRWYRFCGKFSLCAHSHRSYFQRCLYSAMSSSSAWTSLMHTFSLAPAITSFNCLQSPCFRHGCGIWSLMVVAHTAGSLCPTMVPSLSTWSWLVTFIMQTGTRPGSDKHSGFILSILGTPLAGFIEDVGHSPEVSLTLPSQPSHIEPGSLRQPLSWEDFGWAPRLCSTSWPSRSRWHTGPRTRRKPAGHLTPGWTHL